MLSKTNAAKALAIELNLYNTTPGVKEREANIASNQGYSDLLKFTQNGRSSENTTNLAGAAQVHANMVSAYSKGIVYQSSFNVEDIVGLGLLLKEFASLALTEISTKILGSAQYTGTFAHAFSSRVIAWRYALDPRVERVTLDLGYKKLLGAGSFKWGPRPDVGVLFKSGRVKVFEVMSKTDVESKLFNKNFNFIQRNSIPNATPIVVRPLSLKILYK
jgi:hypothetical protein